VQVDLGLTAPCVCNQRLMLIYVESLSNVAFNLYLRRYTKAKSDALTVNGLAFAAGLASTLALLGVSAAALGKAYGQSLGDGLPIAVSVLAVLMGLNLLEVVLVEFPSFGANFDSRKLSLPPPVQVRPGMTKQVKMLPITIDIDRY